MNPVELQFRTATLGGFHKQDALDYIELMTREQAGRLETAERERDEAIRERMALEEQTTADQEAKAGLEQQLADRDKCLSEAEAALMKAQAALAQEQTRREGLEMQVLELEERLAKVEPAAEAYESVKDRTAGIELEAHHRAKLVELAAQEKIQGMKNELQQWIQTSKAEYSHLRAEIDATITRTAGELELIQGNLQGLSGVFVDQDLALEILVEQFQQTLSQGSSSKAVADKDSASAHSKKDAKASGTRS